MDKPLLIESCLEGGALESKEIASRLRGKAKLPEIEAIISMLETSIAMNHTRAGSTRGVERDEFCGAAREIKALRAELLEFLAGSPA